MGNKSDLNDTERSVIQSKMVWSSSYRIHTGSSGYSVFQDTVNDSIVETQVIPTYIWPTMTTGTANRYEQYRRRTFDEIYMDMFGLLGKRKLNNNTKVI